MLKTKLDKYLKILIVITILASIVYSAFWGGSWLRIVFINIYILPIILLFYYWLKIKYSEFSNFSFRTVLDIVVVIMAGLRAIPEMNAFLPYSGHMLFLIYSIAGTNHKLYRLLAVAMLITTTVFKVFVWQDYFSWYAGMTISMPFVAAILISSKPKESV